MGRRVGAGAFWACLLAAGFWSGAARAQQAGPEPPADASQAQTAAGKGDHWGQARVLDDNALLYPTLQPPPFVATSLQLTEALEKAQVTNYPLLRRRIDLGLFAFRQNLGFTLRLWKIFALELTGSGGAELGTNARAILLLGRGLDVNLRAGLAVRAFRSDPLGTQVVVRGFYAGAQHRRLNLRELVRVTRENPNASLDDILDSDSAKNVFLPASDNGFGFNVSAVKTLGRLFAVEAWGEYTRSWYTETVPQGIGQEAVTETPTAWDSTVGAGFSFDANDLSVPIGVTAEYAFNFGQNHSSTALEPSPQIHRVSAGVFYTGRLDLQVGLVVDGSIYGSGLSSVLRPDLESDAPRSLGFRLLLRYIW